MAVIVRQINSRFSEQAISLKTFVDEPELRSCIFYVGHAKSKILRALEQNLTEPALLAYSSMTLYPIPRISLEIQGIPEQDPGVRVSR
jgi:hypothetical protein